MSSRTGCRRCAAEPTLATGWCAPCERAFDSWSRRHATDIVWALLAGSSVLAAISVGLPLLGASMVAAVGGVFGGFGTLVGSYHLGRKRRRRQFLAGAAMPRAYLTDRT